MSTNLALRLVEGVPLTAQQHDDNMLRLYGFDDLESLLANVDRGYSFYAPDAVVFTRKEGYRYRVAPAVANDYHLSTAGDLLLYVLPDEAGSYSLGAFNPHADDETDDLPAIDLAVRVAANRILRVPAGHYYLDGTLHVHNMIHMQGEGEVVFRFPAGIDGVIVHGQPHSVVWSTGRTAVIQRGSLNTSQFFTVEARLVKYEGNIYGPETLPVAATAAQLVANVPAPGSARWRYLRPVDEGDGDVPTWEPGQTAGTYPVMNRSPADTNNHYYLTGSYVRLNDSTQWLVLTNDAEGVGVMMTRYGRKVIQLDPEDYPRTGRADHSTFRDIVFDGTDPSVGGVADGIWLRTRAHVYGCTFRNFTGSGRVVLAAVPNEVANAPFIWGNANVSVAVDCTHENNGVHGFVVRGSDANGGLDMGCRYLNNGQYGAESNCFLGHTFLGCAADRNGLGASGGNDGRTSIVSHGGNLYRARFATGNGNHMSEAQLGLLVTTTPGTNADVWELIEPGDPTEDFPAWQAAQAPGHYVAGGGYKVTNNNARTVVIGCSSGETEAGNVYSGPFSIVLGGHQPRIARGGQITAQHGGLLTASGLASSASSGGITSRIEFNGDPSGTGEVMFIERTGEGLPWRLKWTEAHNLNFDFANSIAAFTVTGEHTTTTFGTSSPKPYTFWARRGLAIGGNNARRHDTGTAAPTTGEYARGDIIWNRDPSAGGHMGWICTSGGTPGTWKTFGAIAS